MAFGRPQKVGIKRAKETKVPMVAHIDNVAAEATDGSEPAGEHHHQSSTLAALTRAPAPVHLPRLVPKELRLAAAKDVRRSTCKLQRTYDNIIIINE